MPKIMQYHLKNSKLKSSYLLLVFLGGFDPVPFFTTYSYIFMKINGQTKKSMT